jgi:hypothetical protein
MNWVLENEDTCTTMVSEVYELEHSERWWQTGTLRVTEGQEHLVCTNHNHEGSAVNKQAAVRIGVTEVKWYLISTYPITYYSYARTSEANIRAAMDELLYISESGTVLPPGSVVTPLWVVTVPNSELTMTWEQCAERASEYQYYSHPGGNMLRTLVMDPYHDGSEDGIV